MARYLSFLTVCATVPMAQAQLPTPLEVWADFDPDAGDFKEEIVHEEAKDGVYSRDSYISAYVLGEEVRVFCKYSVKEGVTNAPGLMNVHGWMGAPNVDRGYVEDGWAVMAHDYCGQTGERKHFTKYPESLRYGNMDAKVGYRVKSQLPDGSFITDPKQTDDYLWYAIQRRVLSYLLAQKEVDPDLIGAKGYSYGGTIMWNLGTDPRVKAIVAYFGVGWLEYYRSRRVWMYQNPPNEPAKTPGEELYLSTIAPQAHAPHITAASLWLNGTNDHHGGHERGEETFKHFNEGVPWMFAHQPRGHHDTRDIEQNSKLWLEKHVLGEDIHFPAQAESRIVLDEKGVPELHVSPADPDKVAELKMFCALQNPVSFGRAWRDAEATREGDKWVAKMPVMDVEDYVFGFSNIQYHNSVVRSSPFTAAIPSKLGDAVATDEPSTNLDGHAAWFNAGPVEGKDGVSGFRPLSARGTFNEQFSDPKWQAPADSNLSFKFYCTQPQTLEFAISDHNIATIEMTASDDWQEITLKAEQFVNRHSKQLMEDWSKCRKVAIKPAVGMDITKVVFADFKWVKTMPEGRRVYLTRELAENVEARLGVKNDEAWAGGKIRVGGRSYERGLGTHADSKLVFRLGGEFATFNVIAGPDDSQHGQIEMKILVDGEEKWSSGPTRSHEDKNRRRMMISVKDAQTLTLIVDQADGNIGGDHASWANAYLERSTRASASSDVEVKSLAHAKGELQPFLETYCYRCHGEKRQKGQVRFDNVSWEINNNDVAQRWQDVLDQLNGGDMPPEDAKLPSDDELAVVLDSLTGAVLEARQRLTSHGGEITMRRLNRREYSETIRDLFGFGVVLEDIPEDGEIASFDTVGAEQFFTSSHFEKYLELGKKVAFESFRFNYGKRREVTKQRFEPEERVTENRREQLADLDRKMALKKQGATWEEMGFKDEGEAQIIFQQWDSRAEKPRMYLQLPKVDSGVYISDVAKWASGSKHVDIRGEQIFRIRGGVVGDVPDIRKIVRLWDRDSIRGTLRMSGTPDEPQTVEFRTRRDMGRSHLSFQVRENVPENTINTMRGYIDRVQGRGDHTDPRPAIWIDWVEIEGPFYPDKRPKIEEILFPGMPTGEGSPYIWNDAKIAELIEKFAFEAFRRRAPDPEYVASLHKMFRDHLAEGMNHRDAMVEVIGIILASPGFLFIDEAEDEEEQQLTNRELAIRLSYFLWSCPPDEELYAADLSDPDTYSKQVDRMLADPKAIALRDGFMSQWAEFERYDAITVDNREHFLFNEGVQHDAKREVLEFFGALIEEDLPIRNLIDSDFVVINNALATHYDIGLPAQKNQDFQKVALPAESPRGGLMTQTAFLTTGSNGERSSPVIRGALVMEKLLHDEPAPPPPNVPELGSADGKPRSNREMVEMHQQQAVCSSCHKKMDVIGFGLENFDTIGRWRDTEKVGNRQLPIEPGGTLPDGSAFTDVQELKEVLLQHEDDLAREIIESLLAYSLGR
ncbi:MAG: DUF1588 domain-containing protein, partial [Verrucomicrobiota bacterium]